MATEFAQDDKVAGIQALVQRYNRKTDSTWLAHFEYGEYEVIIDDEDTDDYVVRGSVAFVYGYLSGRMDSENL